MGDKISAILGFAVKAGKLVFGLDNIEAYKGRIYSIYYDGGLSEKSQKNIRFFAAKKNAVLIKSETPIEALTGKRNCRAAALTDSGMHGGIIKEMENSGQFRRDTAANSN